MSDAIILSSTPLPENEKSVILDIVSYENQIRQGLPQKQLLEGKLTLNPDRCLISYIPQAVNVSETATLTPDRTRYDLYLVDIPFTLHQAPDGKYYTEVTLWVELADRQHTAFDLFPKNISTKVEVTKNYVISPQIKFQEAEVNLGQSGSQLRFEVLRPTIIAAGESQSVFSWTYQGFREQREVIPETKHALFIAQVPCGTTSLQAKISYELVIAKKIVREWIHKDCEVEPYTITWQLDQSRPFHCSSSAALDNPLLATRKQSPVDVLVLCALGEEARAFIDVVESICRVTFMQSFDSKRREYRYATIQNCHGEPLQLRVYWPAKYGLVETGIYLSGVLEECTPRFAIMTGICAGDKKKVALGDIIVADRAFILDEGKIKAAQEFQPDLYTYTMHSEVLRSVRMFEAWKPLVVASGLQAPHCHIAAMASGNAVRSDNPFGQAQQSIRNAIAFDMEGAAFYRCVSEFPAMRSLLVKGVCDYADNEKNDDVHHYAASVSAIYALAFIQAYVTTALMPRFLS